MASINTGAIISEIRGSVKDQTYSKNAYGPYVKGKLIQTNPDTEDQQIVRQVIADLTHAWQGLTDEQRTLWNLTFYDLKSKSSISRNKKLSGFNAFVQCNYWYYYNFFSYNTIPVPPSDGQPPVVTAFNNTGTELSFTYNAFDSTFRVSSLMKATKPLSPGIMSLNRSFLKVYLFANSPGMGITGDITELWESHYGSLSSNSGKAVWMQFQTVDYQTNKHYTSELVKTIIP